MYFLMIRPQRRKMKNQQSLQSSIDVGDEVMTTSGVYGFVTLLEDDIAWLEIDDNVQIRIARQALQRRSTHRPARPRYPVTMVPVAAPRSNRPTVRRQTSLQVMQKARLSAHRHSGPGLRRAVRHARIQRGSVAGLDLQGGISITQQPVGAFNTSSLDLAVERIRERADSPASPNPRSCVKATPSSSTFPASRTRRRPKNLVKVTGQVPPAGLDRCPGQHRLCDFGPEEVVVDRRHHHDGRRSLDTAASDADDHAAGGPSRLPSTANTTPTTIDATPTAARRRPRPSCRAHHHTPATVPPRPLSPATPPARCPPYRPRKPDPPGSRWQHLQGRPCRRNRRGVPGRRDRSILSDPVGASPSASVVIQGRGRGTCWRRSLQRHRHLPDSTAGNRTRRRSDLGTDRAAPFTGSVQITGSFSEPRPQPCAVLNSGPARQARDPGRADRLADARQGLAASRGGSPASSASGWS